MQHLAKSIANYFLERGNQEGIEISPMKIQKLVYYAHGWHLGIYGTPLINEQVEAWQYGPVIRSLYDEFKRYGRDPITSPATQFIRPEGSTNPMEWKFEKILPPSDPNTRVFLDSVWDVYKHYSAIQLSNMTHAINTPWENTWTPDTPANTDIDTDVIKQYFSEQLEQNRAAG